VPALGDYASMASPKLFQFSKGSEHSEERATLRGKRLLIAEELPRGGRSTSPRSSRSKTWA
jgi:phage/plasmid-associated DNA primase